MLTSEQKDENTAKMLYRYFYKKEPPEHMRPGVEEYDALFAEVWLRAMVTDKSLGEAIAEVTDEVFPFEMARTGKTAKQLCEETGAGYEPNPLTRKRQAELEAGGYVISEYGKTQLEEE